MNRNARSKRWTDVPLAMFAGATRGALFGISAALAELHAAYVTTGLVPAVATAGAVLCYDAVGFAAVGAVLGGFDLRRRSEPPGHAEARALIVLLGSLLVMRSVVTGLYVVHRHTAGAPALVVLRILAPALLAAILLRLGWTLAARRGKIRRPAAWLAAAAAAGVLVHGEHAFRQWAPAASPDLRFCLLVLSAAALVVVAFVPLARAAPGVAAAVVVAAALAPVAWRAAVGPFDYARVHVEPAEHPREYRRDGSARNAVLIVLDTLRADHMELYGYPRATMPGLSRFAERATVYTDVVSNGSWTLPAHASLFTGRYVREHGAHGGPAGTKEPGRSGTRPLDDRETTLAEVLGRHGYRTAAVVANYMYVTREHGLAQGFQFWDARPGFLGAAAIGYCPIVLQTRSLVDALPLRWIYEPLVRWDVEQVHYRRAAEIRDRVEEVFEEGLDAGERPFFLFVNFLDPHDPYLPPGEFADRFPGRVRGAPRHWKGLSLQRSRWSDERLREHLAAQYDSELSYLDFFLGRLLEYLEHRGTLKNTLVVITSDHGEAFLEHGQYHHGRSLYQEEIAVPLIVHDPWDAENPGRVDRPVELREIMPWLLGRLGVEVTPPLAPVQRLGSQPLRIAELYGIQGVGRGVPPDAASDMTVAIDGRFKYFLHSAGSDELYDLDLDPGERVDLGERLPERRAALAARLARWFEESHPTTPPDELDPEQLKRLRSLGYVD